MPQPVLRYFKLSEFDQPGLPESGERMDPTFLELLDLLREQVGVPFKINSGFRTAEHNSLVSTTGPLGPHTTGKAADIAYRDPTVGYAIVKHALSFRGGEMPLFTGIGIAKNFIHLDILTPEDGFHGRPWVWTYASALSEVPPVRIHCSGMQAYAMLYEQTRNPQVCHITLQQHTSNKGQRYVFASESLASGIFVGA